MWPIRTLLLPVLLALSFSARADEARHLTHYVHQRWSEGSEAPTPVLAIAQGQDGYLWVAGGQGLYRFDGARFEPIKAEGDSQRHELPSVLLVTRNGDVWTNFETSHRFAVYRHGALHILDAPAPRYRVTAMAEGNDGSIWALTANFSAEVLRYHNGRWRTYNSADGLPAIDTGNLVVSADGSLWVGCSFVIARLPPGGERFEDYVPMTSAMLSRDPAGRVWMSERHRSAVISGPGGRVVPAPRRGPDLAFDVDVRGKGLFDRAGNLWITTRYNGIKRITQVATALPGQAIDTETFGSREGLSSDVVTAIFEDREGNIWVGTEKGLDKFRPAMLITEPALTAPAAFGDKLLSASDGSVYVGQSKTIYRVKPGGAPEPILRDVVEPESLCEAPDGAIWVGLPMDIVVWANGRVRQTIPRPDRDGQHNYIYDCAFDAHGDYWISAAGSGVHRHRDGQWETVLPPGEDLDAYPTTMVRTPQGGVVLQKGDKLVWLEDGKRTDTQLDFGAGDRKVLSLYTLGDDVFAAGAFGLSRYRDGRAQTAWAPELSPNSRINGIARTPEGDLWLAYPRALVRMGKQEFEQAFNEQVLPPPTLSLGPNDGLTSRPHSHSQRSMVRGGDGRLWIATETGTLWMDPAKIVRNQMPPALAIRSINGDELPYRDPSAVTLPTGTAKIEIDFAVLSFANPGQYQVRYKLEGFDHGWVDPGVRRQAFYTNLPPGKYRFRVIAANNDGAWNRTGALVDFEIPPTFFQSTWFLLLCVVVVLAALWALHRMRMARLSARIRNRLEERVAERERIARELHDTLLQGVHGLILRFQAVTDQIPATEKTREQLESALAVADDVVVDARNRVRDLRGTDASEDLVSIIERLVAETPFDPLIPVRILFEGKQQPLNPMVSAEITRILREALLNVAYHAHATWAEIAIGSESRHLAIRIRDNGVGIPERVLTRGHKDGHFGMLGMRERAEKIGGNISIASSPGGGSEVLLTLPAKLAFSKRKRRRRAWLPRLLRRELTHE